MIRAITFMMLGLVASSVLSACSECTSTECGGGRGAIWCIKQGRACADCKNHKLTNEKGEKLDGCEDGYENGKIVSCDNIIKRDIADYCASGKVCTGLDGACSSDSDCCSGVCGAVSKRCITTFR